MPLFRVQKPGKEMTRDPIVASEPNAHDAEYADGKVGDVTGDQLHPRQA
jgi:hypothetical protein